MILRDAPVAERSETLDDLMFVELMEAEAGRLSPAGRDTWALVESAAELNAPGSPEFGAALPDLALRLGGLPREDSHTIRRLIKLYPERKNANDLEESAKTAGSQGSGDGGLLWRPPAARISRRADLWTWT